MQKSISWPFLAALVGALTLSACSGSAADDGWASCYVGTDSAATCIATKLEAADDKLYALDDCRSGNGILKDSCPTDNLLGVCSQISTARTAKGFAPRQVRLHHYRHADLTTADTVDALAGKCGANGGVWSRPDDNR